MEQVASKCFLGLVIDQVIKQLGLEKKAQKIYDTYYEAFKSHYPALKNAHNQSGKTDGTLYEHFQYPIGDQEKLQYYLAYGQMNTNLPSMRNVNYLKNSHPSMLEGFSTNQGAKGKANRRRKNGTKHETQGTIRKRRNV